MARELIFKLGGTDFPAAPVKLERRKIYGWTDLVATDKDGDACNAAYLSPDDSLIIPSGGLKQATVSEDGKWLDKGELVAFGEDDKPLPELPSSFDAPIELKQKASEGRVDGDKYALILRLTNLELKSI